jgi:hypothetical protein
MPGKLDCPLVSQAGQAFDLQRTPHPGFKLLLRILHRKPRLTGNTYVGHFKENLVSQRK